MHAPDECLQSSFCRNECKMKQIGKPKQMQMFATLCESKQLKTCGDIIAQKHIGHKGSLCPVIKRGYATDDST